MEAPSHDEVRGQIRVLLASRRFRGVKLRRILSFLVDEWLADGGGKLTLRHIAESLKDEPLTFEEDSDRWGYPKTRANLAHVRKRLRHYYEAEGYRDRVIIKLDLGSYAPLVAYNPVSTAVPDLNPTVARLVLRAKIAIDLRTLWGAWRALQYYTQIPLDLENPRQLANILFIPIATASIIPSSVSAVRPVVDLAVSRIKQSGVEPWESIFAEACTYACYRYEWPKALDLMEVAVNASLGEARYFWWYTALLASQGRMRSAIDLLSAAVHHFSRTNIAIRSDLAMLLIMAKRYDEAEEHLSSSFDFSLADNPLLACHLAFLYEAQDRLEDSARSVAPLFNVAAQGELVSLSIDEALRRRDWHIFLNGMFALVAGRSGAINAASEMLEILLACKAKQPASSSVEIALAQIGIGQLDRAVEWLRKAAFEENDPIVMWFHIFPPLRHLRFHKGYLALLKELHLPVPHTS